MTPAEPPSAETVWLRIGYTFETTAMFSVGLVFRNRNRRPESRAAAAYQDYIMRRGHALVSCPPVLARSRRRGRYCTVTHRSTHQRRFPPRVRTRPTRRTTGGDRLRSQQVVGRRQAARRRRLVARRAIDVPMRSSTSACRAAARKTSPRSCFRARLWPCRRRPTPPPVAARAIGLL